MELPHAGRDGVARALGAALLALAALLAGCGERAAPAGALHLVLSGDGEAGAGERVALGREARVAWSSEAGASVHAVADAVPGAAVSIELAFRGDAASRWSATIDARRDGDAWQRIDERAFGAAPESRWHEWTASLGAPAGEALELRFSAAPEDPVADGARVLWAVPELVPPLADGAPPNVLLVTLHAARPDDFEPWDAARRTPALARLAADGIVFERAFATSTDCDASLAALLGAAGADSSDVEQAATLAELLRARGYTTAAASGGPAGTALPEALHRGFDRVLEPPAAGDSTDGAAAVHAVLRWLETWSHAPRPWFVWLHLVDAGAPYAVPAAFLEHHLASHDLVLPRRGRPEPDVPVLEVAPPALAFLRGITSREHVVFRRHAAAAYTDALLENALAGVAAHGALARTAVIVVADHGEALGERDELWFSSDGVLPETVHVPLVVAWPGAARGVRVATAVSTRDVAATLTARLGLAPRAAEAIDLVALAERPLAGRRVAFARADGSQRGASDGALLVVETEGGGAELGFDVVLDDAGRRVAEPRRLGAGELRAYRWVDGAWTAVPVHGDAREWLDRR